MECITDSWEAGVLYEGIIWSERRKSVFWVDIPEGNLYEYSLSEGIRKNITKNATKNATKHVTENVTKSIGRKLHLPGYLSCLIPTEDGRLIGAFNHELLLIHPDTGVERCLGSLNLPPHLRFNDGSCSPDGRILMGTMATNQKTDGPKGQGALYSYGDSEGFNRLERNMTIPNGMAWSVDKSTFYHVETADKTVFRYEYNRESGQIKNRRPALVLDHEPGSPDGMAMDTEGRLWIAMWGQGGVVCYDPKTGAKVTELSVPDSYVSCCTFGGDNLDQLFITTARDEEGRGGHVYREKVDARGFHPYEYA